MKPPAASSRTTWRAAAAVLVVAAYVAGAMVSGRLDPLARRPLLDGFGPPPAYRYVSPPPGATATKPPAPVAATLHLGPKGTATRVVNTQDLQATIALGPAAVAPRAGETAVRVIVTPLAPSSFGAVPSGLVPVGNVYRLDARYEPSGTVVTSLRAASDVYFTYPGAATPGFHGPRHTILYSADGRTWTALPTRDEPAVLQATVRVRSLGYFVVAESAAAAATAAAGSHVPWLPVVAVTWVLAMVALLMWNRRRAARRREGEPRR